MFRVHLVGYLSNVNDAPNRPPLVVFGITGDLARRKIFSALYELSRAGRPFGQIIGVGRSDWSTADLRRNAVEAVPGGDGPDSIALATLVESLAYVKGDYGSPATFEAIAIHLGDAELVLCYLAVPPTAFAEIAEGLGKSVLASRVRLLVEKPFGFDLRSALDLHADMEATLSLAQIFLVDHYLEKTLVQQLSFARRDNAALEALWESQCIESVEILMAEGLGIEGRAEFFDSAGTIRDTVQNHVLQLLTAVAMETPASDSADALNDARHNLLRSVETLRDDDVVLGQYDGYLETKGVDPSSTTETYVRAAIRIDNDRWRNVVFTLISGKALAESKVSVSISFRPANVHSSEGAGGERKRLVIELSPKQSVTLDLAALPTDCHVDEARRELSSILDDSSSGQTDAYACLFDDATAGDRRWFSRMDVVAESWRVVQDILHHDPPAVYAAGSWGPSV